MSRPRVLVTGATGFVGRALVPRLLAHTDVTLLLLEDYGNAAEHPRRDQGRTRRFETD